MALLRFGLTAIAVVVTLGLTVEAVPERGVLYTVQGLGGRDHLGMALASLDDVDGDDFRDFAAGAESAPNPSLDFLGYVVIVSGRTGVILRRLDGSVRLERLGYYLSTMGDLNGDGKRELVIGGRRSGGFSVHCPVSGECLLGITIDPLKTAFQRFDDPGDVDGDGVPDIAYGDVRFDPGDREFLRGRVSLYSGATGIELWRRTGEWMNSSTGLSVLGIRDVDGDGLAEVTAVETALDQTYNRLLILKGSSGEVIGEFPQRERGFGRHVVRLGDFDGDGFAELGVASQSSRGRVYVVSGSTFEVLYRYDGFEPATNSFSGDWLGDQMSDVGDVDGDGIADFLVGTYRDSGSVDGPFGRVYLHSGGTGRTLAVYEGQGGFGTWVTALAPLGDANDDGKPEFLIGSAFNPVDSVLQHGVIRAVTFDIALPTFLRGDASGDGTVTVSDVVTLLKVLFLGHESDCLLALDLNRTVGIDVGDAAYLLRHLFDDGFAPPPPPPFPECARYGGIFSPRLSCERWTCIGH